MFVDKKKFESYFSDRLTFSNIRGRTSRQIYRQVHHLILAFIIHNQIIFVYIQSTYMHYIL